MAVTYTNRKGRTYTLCQGLTKTGKPRYYFTPNPQDNTVDKIPEGYEIRESVNAVVSLARIRPALIRPDEVAAVEAVLARHPKADNYRVSVKGKTIAIHERVGPDLEELATALGPYLLPSPGQIDSMQAFLDRSAQFTPVLRFVLTDAETRDFEVQRWCYLGSIDGWIRLWMEGTLAELAGRTVPTLGSDEFFDLH